VSTGAADVRPRRQVPAWRLACLLGAFVVFVLALAPPLFSAARQTEYAQAIQFSLLAIVVPALTTLGAPWRWLRLAADDVRGAPLGVFDRLAEARRRHRELPRSLACITADLAVIVAWHTPGGVSAVARHPWLTPVEGLTLLAFGVCLWLELVQSPPLAPRSGHLRTAALAALITWALWILAYVAGLSNNQFYTGFHHTAGGLGAAADQQIASAILWLVTALAFVPVIFWHALMWLKTEDDPDTELIALLRAERRRGRPPTAEGNGGRVPTA
jgi:cytochrome c oxidase assembly factor CtaG